MERKANKIAIIGGHQFSLTGAELKTIKEAAKKGEIIKVEESSISIEEVIKEYNDIATASFDKDKNRLTKLDQPISKDGKQSRRERRAEERKSKKQKVEIKLNVKLKKRRRK